MDNPSDNPIDATPVLRIRDLAISLPPMADRPMAVQEIDLEIRAGETLCIVGESGSGKSMVANAVMGLLPGAGIDLVRGDIEFDGTLLSRLNQAQWKRIRGNRLGMIFQDPMTALNPVMTIGQQLNEVLMAHTPSKPALERRERVVAALQEVGLPRPEQIADSFPFRLSGGQRQRVMIACALLLKPALLIADEPTTALDVTTQAQILSLIKNLQTRYGTAVLFITHDFGVVAQIADSVAVMEKGRIVEKGPATQVLASAKHPYTRKLIAAIPSGRLRAVTDFSQEKRLLEIQNLHKVYKTSGGLFKPRRDVDAVQNVSFTLHRGETLGLVGESGSGKSSIGKCVVGLSHIDGGRILFKGKTLPSSATSHSGVAGKIQMVFQDPSASLNPRERVGDAIAAGPIAQGMDRASARERARSLLETVGLDSSAFERYPHQFSGGQKQRIGIARALACDPEVLVADEPVSSLDVSVQSQVLRLFEEVRDKYKLTMVFITHDLRIAGQLCDRIAVMKGGQMVEYGPTAEVLRTPRHAYTRELIAAVPSFA